MNRSHDKLVGIVAAFGLAALSLTAAYGGLAGWAGWAGLVLGVAAVAGTVAIILASRRTVVTLRESGAPLDLDPDGAPRFPLAPLFVDDRVQGVDPLAGLGRVDVRQLARQAVTDDREALSSASHVRP